jgi:tetratricopeptide (TPR) repeat protein
MNSVESKRILAWLALAILVSLAYFNGLHAEFTYDDKIEVIGNRTIRTATDWQTLFAYNWSRPLVMGSYALNYQLGGPNPYSFHLVDLGIQIANAGLALLLLSELLLLKGEKNPLPTAFLGAAIWAVHPLGVESVTYVTGRSEQLLGFFVLYGAWLWTRWLLKGGALLYWGAWAAVIVAGLCKESAVILPVFFFLIDWLLRPELHRRKRRWPAYLPGVLLLFGMAALRILLEGTVGHPNPQRAMPTQWLTQGEVLIHYLQLAILPLNQSVFHDYPEAALGLKPLLAWGLLFALSVFAWRKRRSNPLAVLGWTFFLVAMAPTVLIPLKETMAEHRTYIGLLGLSWMVGIGLCAFRDDLRNKAGAAFLILLVTATFLRTGTWQTEVELWADAAAKSPESPEAHYGHGEAQLYALGKLNLSEAEREALNPIGAYKRAVELDGEYLAAWNKLGIAHAKNSEYMPAIGAWQALLSLDPKHCKAHTNLGKTFVQIDQQMEGLRELKSAVTYCPNHAAPHYFLGLLYQDRLGDPDKAIFHFQRLLGLAPDFGCPFGKAFSGQLCIAEEVRERLNALTW